MKKLLIAINFVFAIMVTAFSQRKAVTGVVTAAEDGTALPGVTVVEKGTQNASFTDLDGNYSIQVTKEEAILVFSFIGYTPKNVSVAGKGTVNVSLEMDVAGLEEVIVVAMATKRGAKFQVPLVPLTRRK